MRASRPGPSAAGVRFPNGGREFPLPGSDDHARDICHAAFFAPFGAPSPVSREELFLMTTFLQQLVNGLSLGSIYALIALGYTMVYGVLRLINFAHGDVYMVGA